MLEIAAEREARGKAEGEAKGELRGKAESLLTILSVRGFEVTDEVRSRVLGCRDEVRLAEWTRRAVTAITLQEVFG
jgi:predicted transposase YdaD